MKTVKSKVLLPFYDIENDNKKRLKNQEFTCDEKRARQILSNEKKLIQIIEITKL